MNYIANPAFLLLVVSSGALVTIWLGYPALMLLRARFAPRLTNSGLPESRDHWPTVTAVLATRDDAAVVAARISNLLDSDYPAHKLDVVVALDAIDSACTPDADVGDRSRVRIVMGDEPGGKAAALNAGVRAATGDVLMLMDSRQQFESDTLRKLVAALSDASVGAVSGALTLGRGTSGTSPVHVYWAMEKRLRRAEAIVHSSIGVTGAVYATKRALWPTLPAGTILDDVYVPMSLVLAGYRIGFEPAARATDVRSFDATGEQTRKARTLTGVMQLCRLLPGVLVPWRNPVWGMFVAHKLLRLLSPLFLLGAVIGGVWWLLLLARAAPVLVAGAVAAVSLIVLSVAPLRRALFGVLRWGYAMQVAIVGALFNGARGRWQVWTRAK